MLADRTSIALPEVSQHFAEGGCTQPAGKRVPSIFAGITALPCIQARSAHWQMVGGKRARQTTQIFAFEGPPQHAKHIFDMDNTPSFALFVAINVAFA